MGHVLLRRESGLVVANQGMDEAAVTRGLKRLDDRLVLQKHPRQGVEGGWVYKVLRVWSDSQPASVVVTWMDAHGRALPLSSALLDEVQRHMLGARNTGPGADEHNRRLADVTARRQAAEAAAVVAEHRPYVERGRMQVSMATVRKRRHGKGRLR